MGEKYLNAGSTGAKIVGVTSSGIASGQLAAQSAFKEGAKSAGNKVFSSGTWMFSTMIYTARTGIDYRKYK